MQHNRPIIISLFCLLQFFALIFGTVALTLFLAAALSPQSRQAVMAAVGTSHPGAAQAGVAVLALIGAFGALGLMLGAMLAFAMWHMKRWSLYAYTVFGAPSIAAAVVANQIGVLACQLIILGLLWIYVGKMEPWGGWPDAEERSPFGKPAKASGSRAVDELIFS